MRWSPYELKMIEIELGTKKTIGNQIEQTLEDINSGNQQRSNGNYQLARNQVKRIIRPPNKYEYANITTLGLATTSHTMYHEPKAYSQVVMCDESDKWKVSMKEKIDSLHKNNNQVIVDEPKGKILVDCKWIYKHKKKFQG